MEHDVVAEVARIGREIARPAAREVDADGRFPREAFAALRSAGALGAAVPAELGGGGLALEALGACCTALAQQCASSAMILAMHHIQVVSLADNRSPEVDAYLRRVAAEQRLIASVTSEVGPGGDLRSSVAAVEGDGDRFTLKKQATTISYGREADDLLVTARRNAAASRHDQVMVLLLGGEYLLTPTGVWDALGMRGTCSIPAVVEGAGAPWQISAKPFGDIAAQTMVPVSHVLWAHSWLGIASEAVSIARSRLRSEARAQRGTLPADATRLADTSAKLQLLRSEVSSATAEIERLRRADDRSALASFSTALRMNNLKLSGSRLAVEIVGDALALCGISGYRNDSPYSVARQLRDILSAPLMIQNQRLLEINASLAMVGKGDS